jgi:ectoine hydroxylase-related dioxygenase (phytanoyl-CoA dioxygenase family)
MDVFVCKCLANSNVALIHKGIILSTDKSARQKYHTDGIHLDTEEHQPCYAVNAFFYLIDINKKNGGNEFYMGSHKLRCIVGTKCMVSQVFLENKCIKLNTQTDRIYV